MLSEVAFIVFIVVYSGVITHYIPHRWYSFSNIVLALGCVLYGLVVGLSMHQMGFGANRLVVGVLYGAAISVPILAVVSVLALLPRTSGYFTDAPSKQLSLRAAMYQLGFRIPFGTALSEEVLFRGVLLGMLLRDHATWVALIVSSVVFGFWHLFPTLKMLRSNEAVRSLVHGQKHRHGLALATPVLATTAAGLGFGWLRLVSGGLIAPWIVHTTLNTTSYAGGYIAIRRNLRAKTQRIITDKQANEANNKTII